MKHQFQYFFNKDFSSYEDFLNKVLFPIFGENNFVQGYDVLTSRSDIKQKASEANIEEIKHVGTFSTDLAADIKLFEVVLADKSQIERSRTNIQMLIRRYVDTFEGAFMVFRYKNPVNRSWRFSYVEKRTSAADSTSAKRYTYLFGKDYACRTASQRFFELYSLQQSITLQNITDAFSVEALSNEFFHRYRTIYADFIQSINGKRYEKERGKWVENIKHDPDTQFFDVFEEDDKAVRDFVKKLLGRLVFLQFLQKKGWLAVPLNKTWGEGNTNFMQQLFRDSNNKENFLEAVLEPLFFDTLNSEREGHVANPILGVNIKIPYLNGGLFERDELDDKNVVFPVYLFERLFNFFGEYNFTIDENDPTDAELGIDPEMLGRIFENLLEDNKDKGAFYTPKEIVQYMCQQSLLFYLTTDNEPHKTDIEILVLQHKADHIPRRLKQVLITKLEDVKICDPAIGSGAFPMGMMNEIYKCRIALEGDTGNAVEIKKHIIQHNIYGVDIENGAVDIARLRFWLALVVDETEPHPLPNLDYKIMQGNSLLESFEGIDLSRIFKKPAKDEQVRLIFDEESTAIELLQKNLSDYFAETSHEKKTEIRQKVNNAVKMLIRAKSQRTDILEKLEFINISANNHFFLWHTWFSDVFEQGGFDIVIGNPPYVRQERLGQAYKEILSREFPVIANGIADLYVYFYGVGLKLLKQKGILSYITLNKYLKTKYGLELRNLLASAYDVLQIIDFFELPVFEASTDTSITIIRNSNTDAETKYFPVKSLDNLDLFELTSGQHQKVIKDSTEWKFININESAILDKIYLNTIFLNEFVQDKIYRGITTGLNETFVLNYNISAKLLDSESKDIVKKYAKSTDIKKWGLKNWDRHFLATGFSTDIETKFPTAFDYISQYKEKLENRQDKGKNWWNLRACRYYDDFDKPKLVYIHTAVNHEFFLDYEGRYINNSCYMIISDNKFLFCFLNSKLFSWFKKIKFVAYGDGSENGRCKLDYNKMITVPIKKNVDEKPYAKLVEETMKLVKENPDFNTKQIDDKIDILIYHLYNLTYEEVKIIDPDIENIISRKEYESIKN